MHDQSCIINIIQQISRYRISSTNAGTGKTSREGALVVFCGFYPRDAMLARVIEIATRLSVCLSVRHAPVLCQNEES